MSAKGQYLLMILGRYLNYMAWAFLDKLLKFLNWLDVSVVITSRYHLLRFRAIKARVKSANVGGNREAEPHEHFGRDR